MEKNEKVQSYSTRMEGSLNQLLFAARKAEAEVGDGKSGMTTTKAKAATANDELVSLKKQVSDLVAAVKANQVQGKSKGATTQQNSSNNRNQANKGSQILRGTGQQSSAAGPFKKNQVPHQCYCC